MVTYPLIPLYGPKSPYGRGAAAPEPYQPTNAPATHYKVDTLRPGTGGGGPAGAAAPRAPAALARQPAGEPSKRRESRPNCPPGARGSWCSARRRGAEPSGSSRARAPIKRAWALVARGGGREQHHDLARRPPAAGETAVEGWCVGRAGGRGSGGVPRPQLLPSRPDHPHRGPSSTCAAAHVLERQAASGRQAYAGTTKVVSM